MAQSTIVMEDIPTQADIEAAARLIEPYRYLTPVVTSRSLDERAGCQLFLKCENLQRVGAFKFRGATNAVFSLNNDAAVRGVITHSSGNHAAGLALAARLRGIPAYIVMPANAPEVKRMATAGYGGQITLCEPTQAARESTAQLLIDRTGGTMIHPYNAPAIIAGQATAARELFEQVPHLDAVITPVGGGGLLSGTCLAAAYFSPTTTVYGAEPFAVDDAYRSLISGRIEANPTTDTIADGLKTTLGTLTFAILRQHLAGIVRVTEESIREAARFTLMRTKMLIEPSAAVPLAGLFSGSFPELTGKRVGVIISGGNVELANLLG